MRTLNFAAETHLFCANVALLVDGVTVTAAVSHPPCGEIYWADSNKFGILGRDKSSAPPSSPLIPASAPGSTHGSSRRPSRSPGSQRVIGSATSPTDTIAGACTSRLVSPYAVQPAVSSLTSTAGEVHSGPGIVAARDADSHAELMRLVCRHRSAAAR